MPKTFITYGQNIAKVKLIKLAIPYTKNVLKIKIVESLNFLLPNDFDKYIPKNSENP